MCKITNVIKLIFFCHISVKRRNLKTKTASKHMLGNCENNQYVYAFHNGFKHANLKLNLD